MLYPRLRFIVDKMTNTNYIRRYSELISIPTFKERFQYLKLSGTVGAKTFGAERWVNQEFYNSDVWRSFRNEIIIRDSGCDLATRGFDIHDSVYIHHLNPITLEDIVEMNPCVLDPENVVCVRFRTHNAIHYGDENLLLLEPIKRTANDTCPWKL